MTRLPHTTSDRLELERFNQSNKYLIKRTASIGVPTHTIGSPANRWRYMPAIQPAANVTVPVRQVSDKRQQLVTRSHHQYCHRKSCCGRLTTINLASSAMQ